MKNQRVAKFTVLCLFVALGIQSLGQSKIDYGSNKGKYLTVNNTKIYYEEYGHGTPLFLLHGGLSSIKGFTTVIPELANHFKVIAIDAPGQGRSEQLETLSFQGMAATYSKMIDLMKLDSVYVYGFSVGGVTALHLAADRPDKVKRLIVHSVVNHLNGYNEQFYNSNEMTVEDIERDGQWWLSEHLKRSPQPDKWKKFINDLRQMWIPQQFISDNKLESIKIPVMLLQGDQDMIKFSNTLHMHTLMQNSQLCILPGTTHFVLWENPELILSVITPFLVRKEKRKFELTY
jgi:pimeloyl-ACP methyl ester carboxylesterase